ncbi:TPA: PrgI family protein [Enterococcus faecium]|nr:PrgI family protein [Enterococcus faecium]HCK3003935.1 PrgI family protein [Enterococcus faecium]HCK3767512.1 PrgI family protein [Enterococcus faecium]HCK3769244.1 PrgI family protein [Enterococcus faecium]
MSKKEIPRETEKTKLTRAQRKEIDAVIRKYKGDGRPHTAQQSIPYEVMYPDGVCRVSPGVFSKCIEFADISYQLAQPDTQTAIFEKLCDLYNYVDASIHIQFSFLNRKVDPVQYAKSFEIAPQGDDFDDIRAEYTGILQKQLANGNNGMVKTKYLTFTIEAESVKAARARLKRIGFDLLGYFKSMGAVAHVMDGWERLNLLHGVYHPDGEIFNFDWKWLAPSGLSTKDFIAPSSLCFGNAKTFGMGGKYGAVSFLQILSPELSDDMLADFLNTESGVLVNLHVQAIEQTKAIKTIKRKITDLDAMKIAEQKKAVRSGYDMDILPSDLATYGEDAKKLLTKLQTRNERLFQLTFLVLNVADTKQKLNNDVFQAAGVAQKHNCPLVRLDYQQEQGLASSLPLGVNQIKIQRSLTTSSVAVFVPFVTQELFQGGAAMYYGINAKSRNMIMLDRKQARCPNALKLGTPGSGKSMSCKSEIVSVFLTTPDDIFISDPEAEYYPLVKRLHGQVIRLSPTSKDFVNPLDINLNYSEDDNPLALKSDFVLSFCELVMGGKNGLEAIEKTVIDRAVRVIYRPYLADPRPENMPILSDLHKALLDQHVPEADRVAQALDLYVSGSLNVFNHRTNVDIGNRLVSFDIKELGKQLKKLGMLIVQDQIWGRVTANRSQGKATWYFADKFHLLLKEEQTAAYSAEIWKRFRKWGGIPTGATQNVKDLLSSPEIENILENSDFITLLNQASGDRKILAERLNLSTEQQKYIDNSEPGEGLLIFENVVLPFTNPIPHNTQLYKIMTTRLNEVAGV